MLKKIEALLKKAQSTPYEEEAAAFYSKAQELMEKYAISEESLWQLDPSKTETPVMEIMTLKGDNTHDKFSMLTTIASCNRCECWHSGGNSRWQYDITIAGYPSDITFVTMLFSSLLTQLDLACVISEVDMEEEVDSVRSWRISFTEGFCGRVQDRLLAQFRARKGTSKSTDLVLAREQKVKDYIGKQGISFAPFGGPNRVRYVEEAYDAGMRAGSSADIGNTRLPGKRKELR